MMSDPPGSGYEGSPTGESGSLGLRLGELVESGDAEARKPQQPVRLEGRGAWSVEAGTVELFATEKTAEGSGSRRHLGTLGPGQLFFACGGATGTGQGVGEPSTQLLAVPARGSRWIRVPRPSLKQLARDVQTVEELSAAVEHWVDLLVRAVAPPNPPQRYQELRPGTGVDLDAEHRYGRPTTAVVWVRHVTGNSRYLGLEDFLLEPRSYLTPVPEMGWLEMPVSEELASDAADSQQERADVAEEATDDATAGPRAELSCVGTLSLLQSGGLWESLEAFHGLYLRLLKRDRHRRWSADRARLERQAALDLQATQRAAVQLASTLDPRGVALPVPAVQGGGSELLSVCRRVGETLGLKFPAPPELGIEEKKTVTLDRLCQVARVRHRRVILREGWWNQDNGPLLGFLRRPEGESGPARPVALLPHRGGYQLWDPWEGGLEPVDEAADEALEGAGYMFYPKLPERAVGWRDLAALGLRGSWRDLWIILATGAAGGLLAVLLPIVTAQIVGNAIPEADHSRLLQMVLALGVAAVAAACFQITRSFAVLHTSGRLEGWLQSAVWDRLLSLPVSFFRRYTVGDLAVRSLGIETIRAMITGNVLTSALSAVFSVFSFAILFYYSWRLALAATGMVLLLLLVSVFLSVLQLRRQRVVLKLQGRLESVVFSLIRGISKLRIAGAEARAFARWAEGFSDQRRETIRARRLAIAQAVFSAIYGLGSTLVIFAVVGISMQAQMPVHELLAFNAAFGQFQAAALGAISTISGLLAVVPTYERLKPILDAAPEVDELKIPAGELLGGVELNQVTFRYQRDSPPILDGVSLHADPGEFIALVGPSGAGKSTCLRLLLGFEQPEAGSIYFDGQDLASLEIQSVRRQIGVVLQDAKPMTGTILSNIVGNAPLGQDRAWEAARMAGLAEDIRAMPMGMETVVSEGAGTFSGGQKQRLIIARALVQRPRLLFFDEATSALDNRTQEIVSQSLAQLKATRIVVAHRLSTIRHADRIYVLDRGRVAEQGSYDELVAAGGLFYRLARRQMV
ncbi:MAG: NHLP bacteriocin export ABC transporter permease/ATPase subunit [Acidobacteriota bacterium]|nr:NHLP bacteriocin export ABC transporter permease/ATPase subunit [Acidobacteriota bacterium]